jgi:hypothetical protein
MRQIRTISTILTTRQKVGNGKEGAPPAVEKELGTMRPRANLSMMIGRILRENSLTSRIQIHKV